ncbi:MAG: DUF4007 family protein [Methylobacter sp.]|jgi:hypothetical protein
MRDTIDTWKTKGQFAGHETFPLRLLWLKKAYDAVNGGVPATSFHEPDAISRFGVGRNMAVSMRYWALAARIMEDRNKILVETDLGKAIFSENGLDPFIERHATLWLVHWNFASDPELTTTIYFAFNAIASAEFDAVSIVEGLEALVAKKGWRASAVTLKRDVEVFLRSYVRREDVSIEDAAEPLLAELGLVRGNKLGNWYEFVRGPKPTLPDGVFAYALGTFWERNSHDIAALSFEQICYAPGSPGRVFKLDEDSVATRLMNLESLTDGAWVWTDTAGLRQIQRQRKVDLLNILEQTYSKKLTRQNSL